MPVKIVKKGQTDPFFGLINITDVHRLLNDFRKKVALECSDPARNPVQKRYYFDIDFERIKKVAEQLANSGEDEASDASKPKKIRINMALNLQGQLNCEQTDSIENNLSILVCGVDKDNKSLLNHGNFILIEGFNDNEELAITGGGGPCCVQGSPMMNI
jgi:hypothetical protein